VLREIASLAPSSRKIDDVVKLIQSVAGQTNLLALNTTIEAARAANMHKFADTMLAASQAVERAAESLRGSVDRFLRKVAS